MSQTVAGLDRWIQPSIQRALVTSLILVYLHRLGVNVESLTGIAESNGKTAQEAVAKADQTAVTLAGIERVIEHVGERQYAERRKSWTLSNDLQRIEGKIDRLLESR